MQNKGKAHAIVKNVDRLHSLTHRLLNQVNLASLLSELFLMFHGIDSTRHWKHPSEIRPKMTCEHHTDAADVSTELLC